MKIFQSILIAFLLLSCSNEKQNSKLISSFDLKSDIYNFSQKLNNGDTLFFNATLDVCTSHCMEHNTIFKRNDSIFIQSTIVDIYPNNESKSLNQVVYIHYPKDTLNFENLFYSMKQDICDKKSLPGNPIFEVTFKNDTIEYYPKNLNAVLRKIAYYINIKKRLYPNETLYQSDFK